MPHSLSPLGLYILGFLAFTYIPGDWLLQNFDARKAARAGEIDALGLVSDVAELLSELDILI